MDLPESWYSLPPGGDEASGFENELAIELTPGHELYGIVMRAIARRFGNDDILFAFGDGSEKVAVVHLTWNHNEVLPWPRYSVSPNLEAWRIGVTRLEATDSQG